MWSSLITNCWQCPHRLEPGCIHIHFSAPLCLRPSLSHSPSFSLLLFCLYFCRSSFCSALLALTFTWPILCWFNLGKHCSIPLLYSRWSAYMWDEPDCIYIQLSLFLFLSLLPVLSLSWPLCSYNLSKHYSSPDEVCSWDGHLSSFTPSRPVDCIILSLCAHPVSQSFSQSQHYCNPDGVDILDIKNPCSPQKPVVLWYQGSYCWYFPLWCEWFHYLMKKTKREI